MSNQSLARWVSLPTLLSLSLSSRDHRDAREADLHLGRHSRENQRRFQKIAEGTYDLGHRCHNSIERQERASRRKSPRREEQD
jgi:hypothetical protein